MSSTPIKQARIFVKKMWFLSANVHKETLISLVRMRQLGLIYGVYRFIISSFLLMGHTILGKSVIKSEPVPLEHFALGLYMVVALVLLLVFFVFSKKSGFQLFVGFILDVIFLTGFALYSKISDFQIILLHMVVIAASYMLLSLSRATFITLFSILSVLFQQLYYFFFDTTIIEKSLLSLSDSLLLSASLMAVGFLSWSISQRLAKTEQAVINHANEVEKLNIINQSVVKNMVNGIMVLDSERNIIMINAAAQHLLSLPSDEDACGTPAKILDLSRIIIKEHPDLIAWYRNVPSHEQDEFIYDLEPTKHIIQPDQSYVTDRLRISSKPMLEYGQILIIENLSREQSHAQQLKLASLGQLSASIAHEIRNPLAAISSASQLLMEDTDDDDENAEFYEIIYQQTKRVNTIISDVLSLSRQEIPDQSKIDAPTWLRQFVTNHYPTASVAITGDVEGKLAFYFDTDHLEQVMTNLMNNALRHTVPQDNGDEVEIRLTKTETGVFIDVLDYGAGVKDEDIPSLFHPFFTTSKTGTGLGLYLSQSFSEANRAKILYLHDKGRSCFRLIASSVSAHG